MDAEAQATGRRGGPHALATVVRVEPPVSARLGDKAVVTPDGRLEGWVGGACSEPIVIREALAALAEGRPRLVRITSADMEAAARPAAEAASGSGSAAGGPASGVVEAVSTCPSGGGLEVFVEPLGVAPKLLVAGSSPVARALTRLAEVLGYEPAPLDDRDLEQLGAEAAGPDDAVVVATMGHYDEDALAAALRTRAGYVGLVASRRRAAAVFAALRERGVAAADLERVASPAGLDLGPSTQQEIALAILAEIVRERHRRAARPAPAEVEQATDPVCGMQVALAGARHLADHAGRRYWFCGEHCRATFLRDPGRYLTAGTGPGSG